MISRLIQFLSFSALLFMPAIVVVNAQFGVGGGGRKKKEGTTFQELNEKAKAQGGVAGLGGGDMDALMKQMGVGPAEIQKMMGEIDPEQLKQLTELGGKMEEMMEVMANMSPEELEKHMKNAMDAMSGTDMMENIMQNSDYILKVMEESGSVTEEELARMKTDPEYLEQKIKEGLGQMQKLFSDPEVLKYAADSMKVASELSKNPEKLNEMMGEMGDMMGSMMDALTDEQIEEVRQLFLDKDGAANSNPMIKQLVDSMGEFGALDDVINDPKKWKDSIRSGIGTMNKAAGRGAAGGGGARVAGGAGVGEL